VLRNVINHHIGHHMPGWIGKGSRHERGYGAAWVKLRESILRRDNYLCQACLTTGRPTEATHVDHITPKAKGGSDDEGNLQSLCKPCHEAKTTAEAAEAQGRTVKDRATFDATGRVEW
jgi:5-methylcytosine-specific restriction protein A